MQIQITFVDAQGRQTPVAVPTGLSLMRAAVGAGIESVAADCGGTLSCATCHVMVDEPWAALLPPMAADENDMLEMTAAPREAGSRLSCQVTLTPALDGLRVRLPPHQY
jgi:2Fe-2S ferredoxin